MADPIEIQLNASTQLDLFPEDNLFWGVNTSYQAIQYIPCTTPGMTLWLALHSVNTRVIELRELTPSEYNEALRGVPFPVLDTCLCKDCKQYRKLTKKKKSTTVLS